MRVRPFTDTYPHRRCWRPIPERGKSQATAVIAVALQARPSPEEALLDSGASHLVVKAPSLLDRGTTHEPEDEPSSINTASGSLPVRAAGDFLAKLTPPGARGTSPRPIVVRALALLVPGLQSPNLISVSVLAESEGVSVLFDDDGANLTYPRRYLSRAR